MTLALGSRGPEVRALQEALRRAGHVIVADGILGERTLLALRTYALRQDIDWLVPLEVAASLLGEDMVPGPSSVPPAVVSEMETTGSPAVGTESVLTGSIGVGRPHGIIEAMSMADARSVIVDPKMWFDPGSNRNTRARATRPRQICLHWTAGTRGAEGVVQTLRARDLSIGYVVEPEGRTVQTADDMTRCAHVGSPGSDTSIGVECVSRGIDKSAHKTPFLGHAYALAPWPSAQLCEVVRLCEMLCEEWSIPRVIAPERRGISHDFEGVVGHFSWHPSKLDPGPFPFAALYAAGFVRAL